MFDATTSPPKMKSAGPEEWPRPRAKDLRGPNIGTIDPFRMKELRMTYYSLSVQISENTEH